MGYTSRQYVLEKCDPYGREKFLIAHQLDRTHDPVFAEIRHDDLFRAGADRGLQSIRGVLVVESPPGSVGCRAFAGLDLGDRHGIFGVGRRCSRRVVGRNVVAAPSTQISPAERSRGVVSMAAVCRKTRGANRFTLRCSPSVCHADPLSQPVASPVPCVRRGMRVKRAKNGQPTARVARLAPRRQGQAMRLVPQKTARFNSWQVSG